MLGEPPMVLLMLGLPDAGSSGRLMLGGPPMVHPMLGLPDAGSSGRLMLGMLGLLGPGVLGPRGSCCWMLGVKCPKP